MTSWGMARGRFLSGNRPLSLHIAGLVRAGNIPLPEGHLAGLAALLGLHRLRPVSAPGPRQLSRLMGVLAVGAGLAVIVRAVVVAGQDDIEQPARLLTTGPYAVSRNPMYVGWALLHLGLGVTVGSAWTLLTVPAAVTWTHRDVTREERALAEQFGEEYAAYRATVPRYLPTVVRRS